MDIDDTAPTQSVVAVESSKAKSLHVSTPKQETASGDGDAMDIDEEPRPTTTDTNQKPSASSPSQDRYVPYRNIYQSSG